MIAVYNVVPVGGAVSVCQSETRENGGSMSSPGRIFDSVVTGGSITE